MGMYDDIRVGDRLGQVKLWNNELKLFKQGDKVPFLCGQDKERYERTDDGKTIKVVHVSVPYSIAMREGGFVNIKDGRIDSWTDAPETAKVVDKYGTPFDVNSKDKDYFFNR